MSEIPCAQPFEDGTHCEEPRGHELPTSYWTDPIRADLKRRRETEAAARAELSARVVEIENEETK